MWSPCTSPVTISLPKLLGGYHLWQSQDDNCTAPIDLTDKKVVQIRRCEWVDKNLKDHGLIQAFSRTNRILNSVKTFGNIVCFRNLETATNNALALFGDKNARGMVILKTYNEYMKGYEDEHGKHIEGYSELLTRLVNEFPIGSQIIGEDNEKNFIKLFGSILKLRNILRCFDDFENDSSVLAIDLQDYQSIYIDLYQDYAKKSDIEKERINDDIVFEIELIKQVEVNIDYILMLVVKYHESNCEDKTIIANINKSIDASVELRSKKALIEAKIAVGSPRVLYIIFTITKSLIICTFYDYRL